MKYASINKGRQLETVRLLASFSNSMFTGRLMWLLSSVSHFKRLCGHLGPCALTKLQFFLAIFSKIVCVSDLRPRSTQLNLLETTLYSTQFAFPFCLSRLSEFAIKNQVLCDVLTIHAILECRIKIIKWDISKSIVKTHGWATWWHHHIQYCELCRYNNNKFAVRKELKTSLQGTLERTCILLRYKLFLKFSLKLLKPVHFLYSLKWNFKKTLTWSY